MTKRSGRTKAHEHPVTLQFAVRYQMPKTGRFRNAQMPAHIIREAIDVWIEEGEAPQGFDIKPIAWDRPGRSVESYSEEEFRTLLGRLLSAGSTVHITVRSDEGI